MLGYDPELELKDNNKRRKHGLPAVERLPKYDSVGADAVSQFGVRSRATFHATVSTSADQIAHFIANDVQKVFTRDVTVDFKGVHAAGDVVIVEERMQATLFNGRHYDFDYCFVFELEDGLITVMREYMDTAKGFRMIFGEEAGARLQAAGGSCA